MRFQTAMSPIPRCYFSLPRLLMVGLMSIGVSLVFLSAPNHVVANEPCWDKKIVVKGTIEEKNMEHPNGKKFLAYFLKVSAPVCFLGYDQERQVSIQRMSELDVQIWRMGERSPVRSFVGKFVEVEGEVMEPQGGYAAASLAINNPVIRVIEKSTAADESERKPQDLQLRNWRLSSDQDPMTDEIRHRAIALESVAKGKVIQIEFQCFRTHVQVEFMSLDDRNRPGSPFHFTGITHSGLNATLYYRIDNLESHFAYSITRYPNTVMLMILKQVSSWVGNQNTLERFLSGKRLRVKLPFPAGGDPIIDIDLEHPELRKFATECRKLANIAG